MEYCVKIEKHTYFEVIPVHFEERHVVVKFAGKGEALLELIQIHLLRLYRANRHAVAAPRIVTLFPSPPYVEPYCDRENDRNKHQDSAENNPNDAWNFSVVAAAGRCLIQATYD